MIKYFSVLFKIDFIRTILFQYGQNKILRIKVYKYLNLKNTFLTDIPSWK